MIKNNVLIVLVISSVVFLRVLFDGINQIETHYEEAQYWVWSQNLSLSYLSKGPFIASAIKVSNIIFGQTYLGLKFFSYLAFIGSLIFLTLTSKKLTKDENNFSTGLLISAFSPALFILGGVASTDIFLFFFWSLALYAYVSFYKNRDERWFYVIALSVGLGTLTKLSMALLPLSILAYFLFSDLRKYFLSAHLYLAALLALIVCSPILVWNAQNDWVSISHEIGHLVSAVPSRNPEILLLTLFFTIPSAIFLIDKETRSRFFSKRFNFLLYPVLVMVIFFVIKSFSGKIQPNWSIPVFLTLIPIFSCILDGQKRKILLPSFILVGSIFILANKDISSRFLPYDPLHPTRGWNETFHNLIQNESYSILVSNDYKLLSSLAYFKNEPEKIHLISDKNTRLSHYNLWNRMKRPSDNILYVTYSNNQIIDDELVCTLVRNVDIYTRKQLTLYNCTSK